MSIEVCNISKTFGTFTALKNVTLTIPTGKLVALLGPSGSGKTTLLRIIAGLETPDQGTILFHGEDATEKNPKDRSVGFVFQHYALFRHMTVFENIAFGLRVRPKNLRFSEKEIQEKVHTLLQLVHLDGLASRYPTQLSGGQRQRVALARALAVEPRILLLDEPFGALDAKVRKELRRWLRRLHDDRNISSIFVTHDQEEALEVADLIIVLNEGRIEQIGAPEDVYHQPANPFVYHFLGNVNLFHGRVEGNKVYFGDTAMELPEHSDPNMKTAAVYVRPHLLDLDYQATATSHFKAKVKYINAAGSLVKVELVSEWGDPVQVELTPERYQVLQLKKEADVYVVPKNKQDNVYMMNFSI
jgi:sulfate transport system ATP-binding protein